MIDANQRNHLESGLAHFMQRQPRGLLTWLIDSKSATSIYAHHALCFSRKQILSKSYTPGGALRDTHRVETALAAVNQRKVSVTFEKGFGHHALRFSCHAVDESGPSICRFL